MKQLTSLTGTLVHPLSFRSPLPADPSSKLCCLSPGRPGKLIKRLKMTASLFRHLVLSFCFRPLGWSIDFPTVPLHLHLIVILTNGQRRDKTTHKRTDVHTHRHGDGEMMWIKEWELQEEWCLCVSACVRACGRMRSVISCTFASVYFTGWPCIRSHWLFREVLH